MATALALYTYLPITFHNKPMRSVLFNPFPAQEVGAQRGLGSRCCQNQNPGSWLPPASGRILVLSFLSSQVVKVILYL